ncbi:unnamed protein product, partial [Schistosoma mattheei]
HLPLQCWIPQEFSRSWEEYAEHYCWVTNTYFTNVQSAIPPVNNRTTVVRYYQWATFVFILQAAGFFLPCLIWRLLQNHSGFHVQRIMRSAIRLNCAETDSSQLITYGLARYIDNVIYHRSYKQWRIHSPKIKSHLKHKSPQNHSMIKSTQKSTSHTSSSTTLTSTSHDIGTETKFVKFDNESLPTKQTSNPCKTLPNESMVKFYSPICNTCGLCFNNLSIIDRKIKTRSIQSLVTTSTITEISPPPPSASSSSSSSSSPPPPTTTTTTPTELTTGAILFNSKNNSSKRY